MQRLHLGQLYFLIKQIILKYRKAILLIYLHYFKGEHFTY